jgi:autotransporter-associated beta strand protein
MAGKLYLAKTNYINTTGSSPAIDVGDNSSNNGPGSSLYLGQTNVMFVDSIGMGLKKQNSGTGGSKIVFNTAFSNPAAYIRGSNGVSPVSTWAIADGQSQSGTITDTGSVDFTGGTVDALVGAMWLGRNSTGANAGSSQNRATLTFTAGTITVNNLTNAMLASSVQTPAVYGTINVNGPGKLTVNSNLVMGALNGFSGTCYGQLIISGGGEVWANNIIDGGGTFNSVSVNGGTLIVSNNAGTLAAPIYSMNLSSSTLGLFVDGSTNLVVGTLNIQDPNTVNIYDMPALSGYPSTFPIIGYSSGANGSSLTLGTMPGTYTGYISNDTAGTFWLVVTGGPATAKVVEWGGGINNNWDTSTLNWTNKGVAAKYAENDFVTFDDVAQSSSVNLTVTHTPSVLNITNFTKNYTFAGIGSISADVGLIKEGSASLTLSETGGDNFTGGVEVDGGTVVLDNANSAITGGLTVAGGATVQIGNGDTLGGLPAGSLQVDGALVFKRTDNVLVGTPILGGGSLNQTGSGVLTLSSTNGYTGNTTVSSGTLALTGAGSISSSAQVTVNNATLDLSGVTGSIALNNLSLATSTLSLNADYLNALVKVTGLSGSGVNTINVASLSSMASYPSTIPIVQSSSAISGNFVLGTLPVGYVGSVSLSGDETAVLLTLTSGPIGVRPYVLWSGNDVPNLNTNWSDSLNWQVPGAPGAVDYVVFSDVAAASGTPFSAVGSGSGGVFNPGNFNNLVDTSRTISYLNYSNVLGNYQNTLLGNGVNLTLLSTNTSPRLLTVGSAATDFGPTAQGFVTIAGTTGTLNLNNTNGTVYVGLGDNASGTSAQATLDLSGLGKFNANISRMLIGAGSTSVGISQQRESGVVYLARTNVITTTLSVNSTETSDTSASAASLDIGDNNGNAGPESFLYLGQTNVIFADAICTARQKQKARMLFNSAFSNPSAYFRGQDGVSPVGIWSLADGVVNSGTAAPVGVNDFTGGYVNALINTMYIGRGASNTSGSGLASGTLSFDNGVFNVNALYLGFQPVSSSKIGQGTLNVGASGGLTVNGNLNLAIAAGGAGASSTSGTLNINGGTVQANNVVAGINGGTSSISLNSGALIVANTIGTPSAPLTSLTLNGGTLQLNVNGSSGVPTLVATTINGYSPTTLKIGSVVNASTGVTYPLVSYTGGSPYASLSLTLPQGYVGDLVDDGNGNIGISFTTVRPPTPVLTKINITGTTLNLSATNGAHGGQYVLQARTNLVLGQWVSVLTNFFDGSGNLNLSTNIVNPALPKQFYRLSQ